MAYWIDYKFRTKALKKFLEEKGMTLNDYSKKIGLSRRMVGYMLKGNLPGTRAIIETLKLMGSTNIMDIVREKKMEIEE